MRAKRMRYQRQRSRNKQRFTRERHGYNAARKRNKSSMRLSLLAVFAALDSWHTLPPRLTEKELDAL